MKLLVLGKGDERLDIMKKTKFGQSHKRNISCVGTVKPNKENNAPYQIW